MTGIRISLRALPVFMGAAAAAGCSTVNLQSALVAGGTGTTVHAEGPVETYSRIARGALGCWFRSDGNFKKSHIFHADVESNSTAAEIIIHERDPNAPSPRSLRAMRITISHDARLSEGYCTPTITRRSPMSTAYCCKVRHHLVVGRLDGV